MSISYKYNEENLLKELKEYIDKTYSEHYGASDIEDDDIQTFQLMAKRPQRALNFAVMSALKYADRFGEKEGFNRKDLFKIIHFGMLSLYTLDKLEAEKNIENERK